MHKLLIPVVAHITIFLLAFVNFLLCVPSVVLSPVTGRVETFRTKETLEWLLARVDSLMDLEVRFCVESAATHFFNSCMQKSDVS